MSHEALTPQDEQTAIFFRNQQKGIAENMRTRNIRLETAEKAGQLSLAVVEHDKALQGDQEDMDYFSDEAAKHVDEHLGEYIETAAREAEAAGVHVDPKRPE